MSYLWTVHTIVFFFFFFKQKTAYEIVSRDWSSDVCSSDLLPHREKGSIKTSAAAATKTGQYKKWGAAATRNWQYNKPDRKSVV